MNAKILVRIIIAFWLVGISTGAVSTNEAPGRIEGNGTYFEINDSEYLNITLKSSQPIQLTLESIPEMILMHINSSTSANSSQITLNGFEPLTTYYMYEDSYHNLTNFTTDENGSYIYTQDLADPHFVFIQPKKSTKFIKDDETGGDCNQIGSWDPSTKTCTLKRDLKDTIEIDSDHITLDGNGHNLRGRNTGFGVYLPWGSLGVTVKNLTIKKFSKGIYIEYWSSRNTITNNIISDNHDNGIHLEYLSSRNTITNNIISDNHDNGIHLRGSENNTITNNNLSSNTWDINIYRSEDNIFSGNSLCSTTISFTYSGGIKLKGATSPPPSPDSGVYHDIGKYVDATDQSANAWLFLNFSYSDDDVTDIDENTLKVWKYNGSWYEDGWNGSRVLDTENNIVGVNITSFSIFAPLGTTDTTPPASITNLQNATENLWINWTWSNPSDADFNHTMVYVDGEFQVNTSNNYYNQTFAPHGTYKISTHTVDSLGNVNDTWINQTTKIANNPIAITNKSDWNGVEGQTVYLNFDYVDTDGDTGTFDSNATQGDFNTTSGVFTWNTEDGDQGTYVWEFSVIDGYGSVDSYNATITIADSTPSVNNLRNTTGNFYVNYSWSGDNVDYYNVSFNGSWSNVSTSTSVNGTVGGHGWGNITLCAFNETLGKGLCLFDSVQVPNNPPEMMGIADKVVGVGDTVSFEANATDADGDALIFSCNRTDLLDFDISSGKGNWTIQSGDVDNYYIDFGVSDGWGGKDNVTVVITVDTTPPTLTNLTVTPRSQELGKDVTISYEVWDNTGVEVNLSLTYPDGSNIVFPNVEDTFPLTLTQYGIYRAEIVARDLFGNTVSDSVEFDGVKVYPSSTKLSAGNETRVLVNGDIEVYAVSDNDTNFNITARIGSTNRSVNCFALGDGPVKYVELNSTFNNISRVTLRVNYNYSEITSMVKGSLSLYYWDKTNGTWYRVNDYIGQSIPGGPEVYGAGVDVKNNCVWAELNHFSVYALGGFLDTDGDGIADKEDNCPSEPENFNEYQDGDGCPDTKPTEPVRRSGGGGGGGGLPIQFATPTPTPTSAPTPTPSRISIPPIPSTPQETPTETPKPSNPTAEPTATPSPETTHTKIISVIMLLLAVNAVLGYLAWKR